MLDFLPPEARARELELRLADPGRADAQLRAFLDQVRQDLGELCPCCGAKAEPSGLDARCAGCGHAWPVDLEHLEEVS